ARSGRNRCRGLFLGGRGKSEDKTAGQQRRCENHHTKLFNHWLGFLQSLKFSSYLLATPPFLKHKPSPPPTRPPAQWKILLSPRQNCDPLSLVPSLTLDKRESEQGRRRISPFRRVGSRPQDFVVGLRY